MKPTVIVVFITPFVIMCTSSFKKDTRDNKTYSAADELSAPLEKQNEPKIHIVEIRQMKFEPSNVIVDKGDRVQWINKDITNHDVTEQSTNAWASSPLKSGESWSMVVTESVDYYCNLHQVMKGKITVK